MSLKAQVEKLVADGVPLKLQLGCGSNVLDGWINTDSAPNVDVDYLDFTRPLPFVDNTFVAAFCEHTIEHVSKDQGWGMLNEVFRVLRPNGAFRVVTPDMDSLCRMVLDPQSPVTNRYLEFVRLLTNNHATTVCDLMNICFYSHGHRYIYSPSELSKIMIEIGFVDLTIMRAETYSDPLFNGVDGHGTIVGKDINSIEAMAIEAKKP